MKDALQVLLVCLGCALSEGASADQDYPEPSYPPPGSVGDWNAISERFNDWKIVEFEYGGGRADGGSNSFQFRSSDGAEFEVLVVCSSWWTKTDWEERQQPIYLWFDNKAFRISRGDKTEKRLIEMLTDALTTLKGEARADPRYIGLLRETVKSRKIPAFDWPILDSNDE